MDEEWAAKEGVAMFFSEKVFYIGPDKAQIRGKKNVILKLNDGAPLNLYLCSDLWLELYLASGSTSRYLLYPVVLVRRWRSRRGGCALGEVLPMLLYRCQRCHGISCLSCLRSIYVVYAYVVVCLLYPHV
jgi:hypothetical protein